MAVMELENVPDTLRTAEQTVGKAIQDLRLLSRSLDKEWLHQFNLIENLEAEKEGINAGRTIEVTFVSEYKYLSLEPEAQVMLFRVVQEALQNSLKHAAPKHIDIDINKSDNNLEVKIEDDGKGFDIESAKKDGAGLRSMERRTKLLNGTIEWMQRNEKGTAVIIKIPVNQ
jgi:signal transduction histidine kinase